MAGPDAIANHFFKSFMSNQFNVCWSLFSKHSQTTFLDWTLKDIYQRHPQAAEIAELGLPEVRLMFDNNDQSLMKTFWKRFYYNCNAYEIYRFGYFHLEANDGKTAVVRIDMQYPDGRTQELKLTMLNERGWKFGYLESGLAF
jgi:hypothetical protein